MSRFKPKSTKRICLGVEALEDRAVPTTARPTGWTPPPIPADVAAQLNTMPLDRFGKPDSNNPAVFATVKVTPASTVKVNATPAIKIAPVPVVPQTFKPVGQPFNATPASHLARAFAPIANTVNVPPPPATTQTPKQVVPPVVQSAAPAYNTVVKDRFGNPVPAANLNSVVKDKWGNPVPSFTGNTTPQTFTGQKVPDANLNTTPLNFNGQKVPDANPGTPPKTSAGAVMTNGNYNTIPLTNQYQPIKSVVPNPATTAYRPQSTPSSQAMGQALNNFYGNPSAGNYDAFLASLGIAATPPAPLVAPVNPNGVNPLFTSAYGSKELTAIEKAVMISAGHPTAQTLGDVYALGFIDHGELGADGFFHYSGSGPTVNYDANPTAFTMSDYIALSSYAGQPLAGTGEPPPLMFSAKQIAAMEQEADGAEQTKGPTGGAGVADGGANTAGDASAAGAAGPRQDAANQTREVGHAWLSTDEEPKTDITPNYEVPPPKPLSLKDPTWEGKFEKVEGGYITTRLPEEYGEWTAQTKRDAETGKWITRYHLTDNDRFQYHVNDNGQLVGTEIVLMAVPPIGGIAGGLSRGQFVNPITEMVKAQLSGNAPPPMAGLIVKILKNVLGGAVK